MSSITFADNKLGGRITTVCDAVAAGHLNRAAGIFAELADELNREATATGLLSEEEPVVAPTASEGCTDPQPTIDPPVQRAQPVDLQNCARNVHSFGKADPISGWRVCAACGVTSVVGDSVGAYDMSAPNGPMGDYA